MMLISDAVEAKSAKKPEDDIRHRPRVVVLGEFSAGKSTLINLLTGARSLRTQVTATQMPAVWMSYGEGDPYSVDLAGVERSFDSTDPEAISVADTAYVRTFMKTPALELCDFIDTPGNSDPNIAPIAWERVAALADIAVWCSPCTQAWRQSELAAWRDVPERVRARSILLLTRADKLSGDTDREKVMARVTREAGDLFSHIHMASLKEFGNAREFLRDLIDLCNAVTEGGGAEPEASEIAEPTPPLQTPTGHATALWRQIIAETDPDDPDARALAFDNFLERLDSDFERLAGAGTREEAG